jgi:STE24 endopeptidase
VIDGSTRSAHSNAYFFGFLNNKRIVIYDTLLDKEKGMNDEEITAVIAHELGHWQHSHFWNGLVISEVQIFGDSTCSAAPSTTSTSTPASASLSPYS